MKIKFNVILFLFSAVLFFGLGYQSAKSGVSFSIPGIQSINSPSSSPVWPFKIINREPVTPSSVDFALFWDVWERLSDQYIDKTKVDPQKMLYGAISGMVSSVGDPYTTFLTPEQNKNVKEELGASFEGVGMQLGYRDHQLVVIAPLKDTPAQKAGIRSGDVILKINDKETLNMTLPEAVSLIRGKRGTKVKLSFVRGKEEKINEVEITRDVIRNKSVELEMKKTGEDKEVAYLKLVSFGENTNSEWTQSVSEALRKNPSGVILDMRNNPGGYLLGAVNVASEFIDRGVVVVQEKSDGQKEPFYVSGKGRLFKLPLVVLINKGSASASEIVAGAIADSKRGKLVGEQSFGKGTVQESTDLPNKAGLHITTSKWLTPAGHWINEQGLTPDYKIEISEEDFKSGKDPQLEKALELLK